MRKINKLMAALLALLMVMSLFAACSKEVDKEDDDDVKEKDTETIQANGEIMEEDEEWETNNNKIEFVTQADTTNVDSTTKEQSTAQTATTEKNTTEESDTKVPTTKVTTTKKATTTKAPTTKKPTTKAPTTKKPTTTKAPTTRKPTTTKAPTTRKPTTTKAPITKPIVTKPSNAELLIGTWETTVISEDLPVTLQFKFESGGVLKIDFTKSSYAKLIEKVVTMELAEYTDDELTELGFESRSEAEEYLYEAYVEEVPYDEIRNMLKTTGTWSLSGDKLMVNFDGKSAAAQIQLAEGKNSFVLKDSYGDSMTFTRA